MLTFKQFILEQSEQEDINKMLKDLEELTDEKEISELKAKIELLQQKLSKS